MAGSGEGRQRCSPHREPTREGSFVKRTDFNSYTSVVSVQRSHVTDMEIQIIQREPTRLILQGAWLRICGGQSRGVDP